MDRGRVGTLAIGNKTIRDQMIAHQQEVHMERIRKIMTRKPGSSSTLDNTAPVIIKAALVNPRKIAKKKEFNSMTEKENRVLLKRISNTLTAPPKITDAEYKAMRKLLGNMKGGKAAYEAEIHARHHKHYLDHLKQMGPYYDPNEWELDYKRQKVQQMFMREVPYERPKDFRVKVLPPMKTLGTIHDKDDFKPHFTQLPSYGGRGSAKTDHGQSKSKSVNRMRSLGSAGSQSGGWDEKDGEEYKDDFGSEEARVELACTHRYLRVAAGEADEDEETGEEPPGATRWGEITCYLLNGELLLICARLQDEADEKKSEEKKGEDPLPAYEAEAEIDIMAIAELRGLDGAKVMEAYQAGEVKEMHALARYISESVDLRVEAGVARIILNLTESDAPETGEEGFFLTEGHGAHHFQGTAHTGGDDEGDDFNVEPSFNMYDDMQLDADSLGSAEADAYRVTFTDVVCPLRSVGGPKPKPGSRVVAQNDTVLLTTEVSCEMDVISIEACVAVNSKLEFKKSPAVPVGATFTIKSTLPSIMQADGELMKEYFGNLVENLRIETHHLTGKNNIVLLQ